MINKRPAGRIPGRPVSFTTPPSKLDAPRKGLKNWGIFFFGGAGDGATLVQSEVQLAASAWDVGGSTLLRKKMGDPHYGLVSWSCVDLPR